MSDDSEREFNEEPVYKTYAEPIRVPPPRAEPAPAAPDPASEPAAPPSEEPPPHEVAREPEREQELVEEPVYKTYVQPIRVPPPRAEPAPQAPAAASEPAAAPRCGAAPARGSAGAGAPAPATAGGNACPRASSRRRRRARASRTTSSARPRSAPAGGASACGPWWRSRWEPCSRSPIRSSTRSARRPGSSVTRYLTSFQPIAVSADQDRRSVESAVNAVRRNPKGRQAAAQRLIGAQADRQALIRRITALGPAPGAARALPGRLTQLLRIQLETGRVWLRWMQRRPFKYLKNDAATRNRTQALLTVAAGLEGILHEALQPARARRRALAHEGRRLSRPRHRG